MRRLRRSVAHYRMEKAGLHKVNRNGYFAKHWHEFA